MPVDDAFRALGSPARRRVLSLVRNEPRSVGELARELGVSQPAVSQHLAALRDARLVTMTREGRRRLYRVDTVTISELRSYLDEYWTSALDRLDEAAARRVAERRAAS